MISWQSRKQSSISLSTVEAEYIAACSASCEAIWLQKLLTNLFDLEMRATVILCDNQSYIKMTENLVFHDRSKHIEIRYHYIRNMVQRGALKLQYISTDEQVVDVLTKPLSHVKFEYFRDKLGLVPKGPSSKGGVDVMFLSSDLAIRHKARCDVFLASDLVVRRKARCSLLLT
jgi:hypothetical protein